jgi:hypothetical protein
MVCSQCHRPGELIRVTGPDGVEMMHEECYHRLLENETVCDTCIYPQMHPDPIECLTCNAWRENDDEGE